MDRRVAFAILGFIGIVLPICFTVCHVAETDFPGPPRPPDTQKHLDLFQPPATQRTTTTSPVAGP